MTPGDVTATYLPAALSLDLPFCKKGGSAEEKAGREQSAEGLVLESDREYEPGAGVHLYLFSVP